MNIQLYIVNVDINFSGVGVTEVELDGDLLEADAPYLFDLRVTNFLGGSATTNITVARSGTAAPQVEISPKDLQNVKIAER